MAALSVLPPYPVFANTDGSPLDAGYVYIGTAGLNAQTNPISIYWDAALTIPAAQPIRTTGGYPSRNGSPAMVYANSDYSIIVRNKRGSLIVSALNATERFSSVVVSSVSSANVTFLQAGTGAVERSVQSRLSESVSVKDFGAVGDGLIDDTASIQAAITSIPISSGGTSNGWTIYFPPGKYKISSTITVGNRRITFWAPSIMGSGSAVVIYQATNNITWFDFTTGNADVIAFHGIEFLGNATGTGVVMALGRTAQPVYDSRITNCWFSSIGGTCIYGVDLQGCHITNCAFDSGVENGINILVGSDNLISNNRIYNCSKNGIQLANGANNLISANLFDLNGSANENTAAILINYASTNTRGNSIVGNLFRANQNDIILFGNGGVYASNTGVNDTAIIGNTSDRCYRHFVYATDSHQIRCVGNAIMAPNATGGFSSIDLQGTCDSAYLSGNSVSNGPNLPVYGLLLGATTTNSVIGQNKFIGSSAPYSVTAGATLAYENSVSGTWTPSVGGSATYTLQEGSWTKIGKTVFVKGKIIINVLGTGSNAIISGLPFVADNSVNGSQWSGSVAYFSGLASNVVMLTPYVVNNNSTIQFSGLTAAGATASASLVVFAAGTRIDFSLSYVSAS